MAIVHPSREQGLVGRTEAQCMGEYRALWHGRKWGYAQSRESERERAACGCVRGAARRSWSEVWGVMYVNAIFGGWRPGGATCVSAAAVAVRGQTGSAGAGATQPRRSRRGGRGGAGGGGARRARGDRRDFAKGLFEGTFRRDFSKGLCEGTLRRDFQRVSTFTTRLGFSCRFQ